MSTSEDGWQSPGGNRDYYEWGRVTQCPEQGICGNSCAQIVETVETLCSDDGVADNEPTLTSVSMNVTAKGESAAMSGTKEGEQEDQYGGSRIRSTERRSYFRCR